MMIDIHSHILPGVDDGSKDMNMSIEMAKIYIENNINKVIATPHYIEGIKNTSLATNKLVLDELISKLREEEIDLEVFLGNEVMISFNIIKDLKENKISTLNETKYILIELPMYDIPIYTQDMIYELSIRGYHPIIAHPERNSLIIENPNLLFELIKEGALAQLNIGSIEGQFGNSIRRTGELLLEYNMIDFVSTDAHRSDIRTPDVKNSLKILKNLVSEEDFDLITFKNANCLLKGGEIQRKSPIRYKYKKSFLINLVNKVGIF